MTAPGLSLPQRVRRVLAIRPFRRLWGVTFLCSTADWLALLGVADLVSSAAGSYAVKSFAFSGVVFSNLLPGLLFAPVGGLLADRFDRRKVMAVGDVLRCVLLLSVVVVDLPWWPFAGAFLTSSVAMLWIPAKDAAVPNLLPRPDQVETAGQLGLVMTYGISVVAGGGLYALAGIGPSLRLPDDVLGTNGSVKVAIALAAGLYLASSFLIARRIPELSGTTDRNRVGKGGADRPGVAAMARDAGRFIRTTPLVRGLLVGAVGAFAAGGAVVGSAQSYAKSVLAGQAGFGLLFAAVFVGLSAGIAGAPMVAARLAHERLFGVAIVGAGLSLVLVALSPHLFVSLAGVLLVGACAGATFLTGVTIIGSQVADEVRGRVNALYQSLLKIVLGVAVAVVPLLVGLTNARAVHFFGNEVLVDGTRPVLLGAAALACAAGVLAHRQMNPHRPGRLLADLRGSLSRRPRRPAGFLIAVEGPPRARTAGHAAELAGWLRRSGEHVVVLATDPGRDDPRFEELMTSAALTGPRARALAAAAIRADTIEQEVLPALESGAVVVVERLIDSPLDRSASSAGIGSDVMAGLAGWVTGRLRPDLTVLLDQDTGSPPRSADDWSDRIRGLLSDLAATSRCVVIESAEVTASQDQIRAAVGEALARPRRPQVVFARARTTGTGTAAEPDGVPVDERAAGRDRRAVRDRVADR
ncbi:MFS transporter [Amycolatopsis sp. NPDC049159]|uniref:MFS transporter n=1 Tax=Amycolatopsis sp. NPDC049159 TaxID=3157210 RepID=UPI0033C8DD9D